MPNGSSIKLVYENGASEIGPSHCITANRIGTVENVKLEFVHPAAAFRCVQKIAEDGLVGVEADTCVLQVDHDGVEVLQVFGLGPAVGVLCAVEADDLQAGGGINLLPDVGRVLRAEEPVLGREERGQLDAVADAAQHVDGAAALGVEAGLIGQQADAKIAAVARGGFLERCEVGGFEDIDAGEGGLRI